MLRALIDPDRATRRVMHLAHLDESLTLPDATL